MQLDARKLPATTVLDADICIVGAGPAGLTLAREFVGSKPTVLILESGGLKSDKRAQELNEGAVIGDAYAGLRQTRHRQVGGTAHLWNTDVSDEIGAKYVPLDPFDFDELTDAAQTRWPFEYSELESFYRRAQIVCGLGAFAFEGKYWSDETHSLLPLTDSLSTKVYQCGVAHLFTNLFPLELSRSSNVTLCHHATIRGIKMQNNGGQAIEATFTSLSGNQFCARAKIFILAAGAIENARLLLLSGDGVSDTPGNRFGWVGRCFMEHPRDHALTLIPHSPELFQEARFYDLHQAQEGTVVGGRIALDSRTIRSAGLPNASITLMPRAKNPPVRLPKTIARVASYLRHFVGSEPESGYGWSRNQNLPQLYDAFKLLINVEQRPNPENRVVLAQRRDPLGLPRAELIWRWSNAEQANLERLRKVIASALEDCGIGRVEVATGLRPDPKAHHHAGTTRMHEDPRWGVVDGDSCVHGTDNLFVTGASTFCSVGFANPTLTIVALALRLADHLKQKL
jgi:choline dehydrogenase-like flavoprotein